MLDTHNIISVEAVRLYAALLLSNMINIANRRYVNFKRRVYCFSLLVLFTLVLSLLPKIVTHGICRFRWFFRPWHVCKTTTRILWYIFSSILLAIQGQIVGDSRPKPIQACQIISTFYKWWKLSVEKLWLFRAFWLSNSECTNCYLINWNFIEFSLEKYK